jgi:alpha-tubulin suppressor-like RCC1 family protein
VALTSNGNAYVWGADNAGQQGNGSTTGNVTSPALIMTGVAAIGAGADFTLFVKTDGTVYGTGENSNGQLGDASTTDRTSAVQMSGVTGAAAAAGGVMHSVILLSNGTLKASGYNGHGELGDTTTTQRTSAVAVANLTNITSIAVGDSHTLARESDATVWAFGYNNVGQLGDGSTTDRSTAVEITSLSSISDIGAGADHSLAVTSGGVVYTWGSNDNYKLGDGTEDNHSSPTAISAAGYDWKVAMPTLNRLSGTYTTNQTVTVAVATAGATIRYTQNGNTPTESDSSITSGSSLTVSISQTLKAKAFKSGMPASNTNVRDYELQAVAPSFSPAGNATYTSAQNVTMTTSTSGASIRYTTDGSTPTASSTLYPGSAISVAHTMTLKAVAFKTDWTPSDPPTSKTYTMDFGTLDAPTADQATGNYTNAVTVTLSAMSGATIRYTTDGSTPTGSSTAYSAPLPFEITTTLKAKAFHADYTTSAETSRTYTLAPSAPTLNPTAGTYTAGQEVAITSPSTSTTMHYTINGVEPTESDPTIASAGTLVVGNYTLKVKAWKTGANASATTTAAYVISGSVTPPAIVAGDEHALAIRDDSTVWAWGKNTGGQVGDGTTTSPRLLPKSVWSLTDAVAATGGDTHSHVLKSGGTLLGFGANTNGRLGDGTTTNRLYPEPLTGISAVVNIEDGADHTIALKGDGSVFTWGNNGSGQIGDGTTTTRTSPTAITSVTAASAVAAGYRFSVALKQDGTIRTWGYNFSGQLGNASTTDSTSPVLVASIDNATKIAAGSEHALALLGDGTVVAWGENFFGALGDGTNTDRSSPVAVAGLEDVIAIGAGGAFSVALTEDGHVWTWGGNTSGQLGDGTTSDRWSAAQVSGLSDIVQIAVGKQFVLAMTSDATVYAWGENSAGQIGDGTTVDHLTPIAISGPGMAWRVATPTLSLAGGLYYADQSATVTIADPDATLRYTTTGADPTSTDATVTSGSSVSVSQSQTLKVSGWKTGSPTSIVVARAYELKVVVPALTPSAGSYGSSQNVAMSTSTSGATIRYTTNGAEPTTSSTAYSSAVAVAETLTVKARGYKTGWTASDSAAASYSIPSGTVATPTITPAGGAQSTPPLVAITTTTTGATIRYTLDGSTPTGTSPVFVYPFLVSSTTTVKSKAFKAGLTASAVASTTFNVDASGATETPLIVPAGGRFATQQTVTITGPSGATLRYTTDGSDPTTSSTSITSGNTVTIEKSEVLKVRGWATGSDPSAVRRADFMITGAVSGGSGHSIALKADRTLWTWGDDAFGQLGNGATGDALSPAQVLTSVVSASTGERHTLAAKNDGSLWSWGNQTYGRLGAGAGSSNTQSPTQVSGFTNAIAVSAGYEHSLVLKSDGSVWSFGHNPDGRLGDGSTTDRNTPVQVVGLTGIVAIAAARQASYALQTDGAGGGIVWAWGDNTFGQLGDGSNLSRSTPVRVLNVPSAIAISAGYGAQFGVALAANGQVWAWGHNDLGQVGNGTTADATEGKAVSTISAARVIGAGSEYALAIEANALAWGWGLADSATAIGDRQTGDAKVPERSDFSSMLAVAGASAHTLALKPDGGVAVSGDNGGRYGNGSTTFIAGIVTVPSFTLADNTWLSGDQDLDSLETWREYFLGTDPLNPDTNGNGVMDGLDDRSGANGQNPDVDEDGVPNWIEQLNGTDPFRADTDGDSVSDLNDAFPLDPTRSMAPSSNPSDTTPPVVTLKEPVSARLITP